MSTQDEVNAEKFSAFLLSISLPTSTDDDGVCLIHDWWGAMCLLVDNTGSNVETYRFTTVEWYDSTGGPSGVATETTYANLITAIAVTDYLQDPADSNVTEWFDSLSTSGSAGAWFATGWQPTWMNGQSYGYPRFGLKESSKGLLSWVYLDATAGAFDVTTDPTAWDVTGASTLVAGVVASFAALLAC